MDSARIRNFSIIAHIEHGKTMLVEAQTVANYHLTSKRKLATSAPQ
ncbi:MAG TPA: hypothetical protein VGH42_01040 [Verrucomicrobiae bacterium]